MSNYRRFRKYKRRDVSKLLDKYRKPRIIKQYDIRRAVGGSGLGQKPNDETKPDSGLNENKGGLKY